MRKKTFHKEEKFSRAGLVVHFERLLGERKRLKGIIDRIIIDEELEISKDRYGNLYLRLVGTSLSHRLFTTQDASNTLTVFHPRAARKIEDVLRQEYRSE